MSNEELETLLTSLQQKENEITSYKQIMIDLIPIIQIWECQTCHHTINLTSHSLSNTPIEELLTCQTCQIKRRPLISRKYRELVTANEELEVELNTAIQTRDLYFSMLNKWREKLELLGILRSTADQEIEAKLKAIHEYIKMLEKSQ